MSEQKRWRVERYASGWVIRRPDGIIINITPSWDIAITRAHRLAYKSSTVTVTLPRVDPEVWAMAGSFYVNSSRSDALELDCPSADQWVMIPKEDCGPIARYLLAYSEEYL